MQNLAQHNQPLLKTKLCCRSANHLQENPAKRWVSRQFIPTAALAVTASSRLATTWADVLDSRKSGREV